MADIVPLLRFLWPYRRSLKNRKAFGVPIEERGIPWWSLRELYAQRLAPPTSIAFAFVATHNHFLLDRGGKVFKQSAPVIKLPPDASEDDHLGLLGLLNSSTACFWMKQVFHNKGATSDTGILQADPAKFRFEFDATKLAMFPTPALNNRERSALIGVTRALDSLGSQLSAFRFKEAITAWLLSGMDLRESLAQALAQRRRMRSEMVCRQEELDWLCYELYGLLQGESPARSRVWESSSCEHSLEPEDRPYRKALAAESDLVGLDRIDRARVALALQHPSIRLVERPEFKRRWFRSAGAYDDTNLSDEILIERDIAEWLLDHLECERYWVEPRLTSCANLADRVREDSAFMQVAELYRGRGDFDVVRLVTQLVEEEAVPFLPALRYTPSGIQKRAAWEECWALQRREDAGEKVGEIPVPSKYGSEDFKKGGYYRLRGKLDMPKERFILYPHAERDADPTPVLGWAGWDSLQQAQALAAYFIDMKESEGWRPERLAPLLAGLLELLPWLRQWHNDVDPSTSLRMGDYFAQFLDEEARALGLTLDDLRRWSPAGKGRRGSRRRP